MCFWSYFLLYVLPLFDGLRGGMGGLKKHKTKEISFPIQSSRNLKSSCRVSGLLFFNHLFKLDEHGIFPVVETTSSLWRSITPHLQSCCCCYFARVFDALMRCRWYIVYYDCYGCWCCSCYNWDGCFPMQAVDSPSGLYQMLEGEDQDVNKHVYIFN